MANANITHDRGARQAARHSARLTPLTTTSSSHVDDPFFRLPTDREDSHWNACIGQQGTEENYVDGYIQAAIELASAVIEKRMDAKRDTLVMPILYNARHALELSLKFAISRLNQMGVINSHQKNHDIMSHWEMLDANVLGDEALRQHVAALKPYVTSLSQIDDDGQELRYSENRDGQKSLTDRSHANIAVIRRSLDGLSKVMSRLKYRILDLADERNTGSFTSECSRSDLLEIARMLPPASDWREPAFEEAKADVMKRFSLTNRKFSAAVNVIKGNREMGVMIGLEKDLVHLSDQNARFVVEQWSKCHPARVAGHHLGTKRAERISLVKLAWIDISEDGRISRDVSQAVCGVLTPDEVADLEAIYYIGRDGGFSEEYEGYLESRRKEHCVGGRVAEGVDYLMAKTDFLICIAAGIARLGRPSLSSQLMGIRA
jgi:hypothetical protein